MRDEFLADTADKLEDVNEYIQAIADQSGRFEDTMLSIRRITHSIKGNAGSFGLPTVSRIAHTFEDYIDVMRGEGRAEPSGLSFYVDTIAEIIQTGKEPDEDAADAILRSLPAPTPASVEPLDGEPRSAILAMAPSVQRKIIAKELIQAGIRVIHVDDAIPAIDMALSLRPELMVTGMQYRRMTGLEIAKALGAFERMQNTKVIVLTSDPAKCTPADQPANSKIVLKGPKFAKDMKAALGWAGIT